jgi:tRNA (guanine26-N2/guanine27-N2)-dimethyltransferase
MRTIHEGAVTLSLSEEEKISKKLPVFYNPVMRFNRDMTVLLLKALGKEDLKIGDPLAGSGIRGIRLLKELPEDIIASVWMNDYNPRFMSEVNESLLLNDVHPEDVQVSSFFGRQEKMRTTTGFQRDIIESAFTAYNKQVLLSSIDANLFLLLSPGFDYIDIDPFGSPNPFLDAACMRLAREGILAVTATDTSALCGTYPSACRRKYWSEPMHNELMHEVGLRILIRKAQLVGAQYEKALVPIFSYDRDHYMRIFFHCKKSKKEIDTIVKQHGMFSWFGKDAGPLWNGPLFDESLLKKMVEAEVDASNKRFLSLLVEESHVHTVGFYDIHALCKRFKVKDIPKTAQVMERLKKAGYACARTHFSDVGLRSDATLDEFIKALKE